MKKILSLGAALLLGGCSTVPGQNPLATLATAVKIGTTSVDNPITPERLSQIEDVETILFTALNAWKSTCEKGVIPASCHQQIEAVQFYTRQIPPYQKQLRQYVKVNSQVNARVLYQTISDLIANAKATAASSGVQLGSGRA